MAAKTLDLDRSGTQCLRRVLLHYVRSARQNLQERPPTDEAVHQGRKALKKARAALRLLRPALGRAPYRRTNGALRDAAHALNALRDALVLTQALARVRREHAAVRHDRGTVRLAARLQEELSTARRRLVVQPDALRSQCRRLQRIERRVRDWRLGRHGWSLLGPALCRIYRDGRRALPSATGHPADAALHEWRKQTKYLRYAVKMLAPIRPAPLGTAAKQAGAIAEQLGHAHDLALLQERAAGLRGLTARGLTRLLQAIERMRVKHAFEALMAGEKLFRPAPRAFEHPLAEAWRDWRRGQ